MKLFDIDKIIDTFTGFLETKIELMKLDAKDEMSALIAKSMVFLTISIMALLAVLFLSLGMSTILNSYLESDYLGFLIIGVLYLGLAGVVYTKRISLLEKIKSKANVDVTEEDL